MPTSRLEAFSDGVMAIAITLLVLELRVPEHAEGRLWSALVHEWPQFAAFIVSFLIIGIIWMNHHALIASLRCTDRVLMMLNLLLLLSVALIPFPTGLVAEVIHEGGRSAAVAACIYALSMELMALAIGAMWFWSTSKNGRLLKDPMAPDVWRKTAVRFTFGHVPYITAAALAFVNPWISLVIIFAVALYYAFDQLAGQVPTA